MISTIEIELKFKIKIIKMIMKTIDFNSGNYESKWRIEINWNIIN